MGPASATITPSGTPSNLFIDHRLKPESPTWTLVSPVAEMTPAELCCRLRDLIKEHQGGVRRECVPAAIVLTCLLRVQGLDAHACTGVYRRPAGRHGGCWLREDEHAYVRCEGLIYDPTREQFDALPLVSSEDDPQYEDLSWSSYSPPKHPSPELLAAVYGSPHHSWGGKNGWFTICSELTFGGPWGEHRA